VVGEFIESRRSKITVTTKLGVLPPDRSFKMRVAKPIARRVVAVLPGLRETFRRRAHGMVRGGAFDVPTMKKSLETSLGELRTDHVDYLLLHDFGVADLTREEVVAFLECERISGKIVHYGIATDPGTACAAVAAGSPLAGVVQFASSVLQDNVARVAAPAGSMVITHSALGSAFGLLRTRLSRDAAMAHEWSEALDIDTRDTGQLGCLFLAAAMSANPGGTVLFSSSDPERIGLNARVAPVCSADAGRIAKLRALAGAWAHSTTH
jgi:aryl-alcohol dehydrogenase-like predicted oxidoreductase